jgi:hypothetical protein
VTAALLDRRGEGPAHLAPALVHAAHVRNEMCPEFSNQVLCTD